MNIIQISEKFPTQKHCIKYLEEARWKGKSECPYCKSLNTKAYKSELRHYCNNCKTSFSVTVGTIFHRTHLPLQKWFLAISLILNAKKGLSALQLSRDIEVNKNTAWRISMQIRRAMRQQAGRDLLTGIVEMDETYIGGKPRKGRGGSGTSKRGRGTDKTPAIGAIERGGNVSARATKKGNLKGKHLRAFIRERVNTKTEELITDEYKGYIGMDRLLHP